MTTLEILAPYLPYGIEVEACSPDGFRALFTGISDALPEENPVHVRTVEDGWTSNSCWPYEDVKPVLRSFADLCTPLEDGTVPAIEVAKLATWVPAELEQPHYLWLSSGAEHDEDEYGNEYVCVRLCKLNGPNDLLYIFSHWDIVTPNGFSNQFCVFDYLRSKHFAVGLTPEQYIRKDA
jgi:hypothetical protein